MSFRKVSLSSEQIRRYGRHMILKDVGSEAQKNICKSSVLVVGAGGLGSAVLQHLVGSGTGRIGIVDQDVVCTTNLHRQTIFSHVDKGEPKVVCAKKFIKRLNPSVNIEIYNERLVKGNALKIIQNYDVISDCTDNVDSRYLINDYSVLAGKPLVSAAAIGLDGQLTTYNYKNGPCLRCIFPEKSPPETVGSCSSSGVLGPVPGIMGSLQALEILKVIGEFGEPLSSKLLFFEAKTTAFKTIHLKGKSCQICVGIKRGESHKSLSEQIDSLNSETSCKTPNKMLDYSDELEEIKCKDLAKIITDKSARPFVLIDVRPVEQFNICSLQEAINVPLKIFDRSPKNAISTIKGRAIAKYGSNIGNNFTVFVVCRKGLSSLVACEHIRSNSDLNVINVYGGVEAWHHEVDSKFPLY